MTRGQKKSVCINPGNAISMYLAKKYGFRYIQKFKTWDLLYCDADYYPGELLKLDKNIQMIL